MVLGDMGGMGGVEQGRLQDGGRGGGEGLPLAWGMVLCVCVAAWILQHSLPVTPYSGAPSLFPAAAARLAAHCLFWPLWVCTRVLPRTC